MSGEKIKCTCPGLPGEPFVDPTGCPAHDPVIVGLRDLDAGLKRAINPTPSSPSEAEELAKRLGRYHSAATMEFWRTVKNYLADGHGGQWLQDQVKAWLETLARDAGEAASLLRKQAAENRTLRNIGVSLDEEVDALKDENRKQAERMRELEAEVDELDQGGMAIAAQLIAAQEREERLEEELKAAKGLKNIAGGMWSNAEDEVERLRKVLSEIADYPMQFTMPRDDSYWSRLAMQLATMARAALAEEEKG